MLFDHIEFRVADADRSLRFYEAALRCLGVEPVISIPADRTASGGRRHGLGRDGYPRLWFHDGEAPVAPVHIAFAVENRALVDAFHAAAIAAGGTDNGPPGVRTRYHDAYYAAYVLDPDGSNIEVVCQSAG